MTFGLTILVVGAGLIGSMRGLLDLQSSSSNLPRDVADTITAQYWTQLGVSVAAGILISISAAFAYFGVAGPIYRFRTYFEGLVRGRWDRPCTLREAAPLQDVNTQINAGLDALRGTLTRQNDLLHEVRTWIVRHSDGSDEHRAMLEKIDASCADFAQRMGGEESGATSSLAEAEAELASKPAEEEREVVETA